MPSLNYILPVCAAVIAVVTVPRAFAANENPPLPAFTDEKPRVMTSVARFAYPVDDKVLLSAITSCGISKYSLGEYADGRRFGVEPQDLTDRKVACLKRWADSQKNLRVEWLK